MACACAQAACTKHAVKLAVLGDSLAAGFGVKPEQAFPARLEAALKAQGRNVAVLNHGVSGDTTAGGLDRVDWMLADKPDIVMVELGANDALRGTDPAVTEKNLDAIIAKLKAAGVTVWLAGMLAPRNFGAGVRHGSSTASTSGSPTSIACRSIPSSSTAWRRIRRFIQADGIHPNPKASKIIAERLLPFVTKNLDDYAAAVHRPARP